jgi:hypothetical protein
MRSRGTIIKRGRTYIVVIDGGTDPLTGERQRDWYPGHATRKEAERTRTQLLRDLDTGNYVDLQTQTLADYLQEDWLPSRKPKGTRSGRGHRGQVTWRTWSTNRQHLESYVVPHIGHIQLQRLTADDLDRLYDKLEESGGERVGALSPTTILHVHRTLHKALEDAVKKGHIATNVAGLVDPPRASGVESEVWTVEERRQFLDRVREHRLYAA